MRLQRLLLQGLVGGSAAVGFIGAAAAADIDIINKRLSSDNPDCAAYVGTYTSSAKDYASGQTLRGLVTISANGSKCKFKSNQIPNHNTGQKSRWRGSISANPATLEISRKPKLASTPTALGMGANAIFLNGIKWEAYPAACFSVGRDPIGREAIGCHGRDLDHPWRYNIGSSLNKFGFDTYKAHLQPGGLYHYHSTPVFY